jgi:hypothetical protein
MPEPKRAKVYVREDGGHTYLAEGTAQIDGMWVHVWPDDPEKLNTSYPAHRVLAVIWEGDRD